MIATELYSEQAKRWPTSGRHILANFDAESVIVYQAYQPAIGEYAAKNGYFGGGFSYSRMSWVKPNFLWMMYRSGWGTKPGQEVTLAIRLRRAFFEEILAQAVESTYSEQRFASKEIWEQAIGSSSVRVQWDPDHGPSGIPLERRALQLGLRGPVLERYGRREILEIVDLSPYVSEQRQILEKTPGYLLTPTECVYWPAESGVRARLGLDEGSPTNACS